GGLRIIDSMIQVTKSNATIRDTDDTVIVQSGQRQRVRGLELSATGYVTENWSVLASYTYLDPVITDDPVTPYNIGRQITFVPKNAASFWTDYKATSLLEGLELAAALSINRRCTTATRRPAPRATRWAASSASPKRSNWMPWRPTSSPTIASR